MLVGVTGWLVLLCIASIFIVVLARRTPSANSIAFTSLPISQRGYQFWSANTKEESQTVVHPNDIFVLNNSPCVESLRFSVNDGTDVISTEGMVHLHSGRDGQMWVDARHALKGSAARCIEGEWTTGWKRVWKNFRMGMRSDGAGGGLSEIVNLECNRSSEPLLEVFYKRGLRPQVSPNLFLPNFPTNPVGFPAGAPLEDSHRGVGRYNHYSSYLHAVFFKPLPASVTFIVGCLVLGYGWMRFRTFESWRDFGIGIGLSIIGFILVSVGTACFLMWQGDRIDNEPLYTLKLADNFLSESLGGIIHPKIVLQGVASGVEVI